MHVLCCAWTGGGAISVGEAQDTVGGERKKTPLVLESSERGRAFARYTRSVVAAREKKSIHLGSHE